MGTHYELMARKHASNVRLATIQALDLSASH